jgi:hypothetical protein
MTTLSSFKKNLLANSAGLLASGGKSPVNGIRINGENHIRIKVYIYTYIHTRTQKHTYTHICAHIHTKIN